MDTSSARGINGGRRRFTEVVLNEQHERLRINHIK